MKRSSALVAALAVAFLATVKEVGAIDPRGQSTSSRDSQGDLVRPLGPQNTDLNSPIDDPFLNAFKQLNGLVTPGNRDNASETIAPAVPPSGSGLRNRDGTSLTPQQPASPLGPFGIPADPRLVPNYNPPGPPSIPQPGPQRWRLGVYSKDTDVGVKIMQVVAGSAAEKASLEAEDIIVAVAGYQVGYVNGKLFDCSTEFERSADAEGWVTMLVQNHRNGELVNLPVQLAPRFSTLSGSLTLDGSRQLPADAQVTAELQEIVRPGAAPITVSSARVDTSKNVYPIPFSIEYDPQAIDTTRNYVVAATILSRNRPIYRTAQQYPVFRPGQRPTNIVVALAAVTPTYDPRAVQSDRATQIAQIEKMFEQYLGRRPKDTELVAFLNRLEATDYSMADVETDLLGHDSFFNRYNRDKRAYVGQVLEYMVGRPPRPEELDYWLKQYDAKGGLRREFVSEVQQAAAGIPR